MTNALRNIFISDLREGLHSLMESDERVHLIGEDIADPYGGAFGASRGLSTRFPDRVLSTPISEAAITGTAIGMAVRDLRPIVEIMFGDFITLTMDQLVNVASKMAGMYSGGVQIPLTVRAAMGGGRGYGPTHSQTLDKLFLGIPGLTVVAPSVFHSPAELLRTAVTTSDSPVVFTENKLLYPATLVVDDDDNLRIEKLPGINGYPTAIAHNFANSERADITVVAYGGASLQLAESMRYLADEEIRITAVIPSSVDPLPLNDLVEVAKLSTATVVIEEGVESFGWGAEVVSLLTDQLGPQHKLTRLGATNNVIPAARHLENFVLPTANSITAKLLKVFEWIG